MECGICRGRDIVVIFFEFNRMTRELQVGTILISESPQLLDLQTYLQKDLPKAHYSGAWSVVEKIDGSTLDRKIRRAGWNFFFIASEVKASFWGGIKAPKIESALRRILGKVREQNFNALEITGIVAKRFLGVPYAVVTAHSRHLQQNCYLDGAEARLLSGRPTAKT
jgi:hypothetical protein